MIGRLRSLAVPSLAVLLAAGSSLWAQGDSLRAVPAQGLVSHAWKPVRRGGNGVVAIEVRTDIDSLPAEAMRAFSLSVPITYAGVTGIAERTQRLAVCDAQGDVALRVEDDAPNAGGFPFYRHYRASRPVRSPVRVTYEALAPPTPMRAPPFGLYAAYGGVSGAGSGFLVLPEGRLNVTTRVHWDLSDLEPGATATTSFGDGDVELHGPPADVIEGWIMAGPLGRYPSTAGASGFSAAWLGTPSFDPDAEMTWAARMYAWLGRSYGYLRPLPAYRVFIRVGARGGRGAPRNLRPRDGAPFRGRRRRATGRAELVQRGTEHVLHAPPPHARRLHVGGGVWPGGERRLRGLLAWRGTQPFRRLDRPRRVHRRDRAPHAVRAQQPLLRRPRCEDPRAFPRAPDTRRGAA